MHQLPSETNILGQELDIAIIRAVESFTYEGILDRKTAAGRLNYDRAYQPAISQLWASIAEPGCTLQLLRSVHVSWNQPSIS